MKRIFFFTLILLIFATVTKAQDTYIGGGVTPAFTAAHGPASFTHFNPDSYPLGLYAEAGFGLGHGLQLRGLGEYYNKALYPTLFDNNLAKNEVRLRLGARWWLGREQDSFRPFLEGGVDIYRQGQIEQNLLGAIFNHGPAKSGLNPLFVAGLRIKQRHEVYYTQIFEGCK